jgi:hypothetical protein
MRYPSVERIASEDHETLYWLHLSEGEAGELRAGRVPERIREDLDRMTRWVLEDPNSWPQTERPRQREKRAGKGYR